MNKRSYLQIGKHGGGILLACVGVLAFSMLQATNRNANTDNTTFYVSGSANYATGEVARGFVRMAGGLDIDPAASVTFNVPVPISGTVMFGNACTMTLEGDMYLDNSASLAIGTLAGHSTTWIGGGHAIYCGGDITFPGSRTINITTSDLVIDGNGHVITFGDANSAFNIAGGRTLTLRNMIINGLQGPSQFLGTGAVTFENVIINLEENLPFTWNDAMAFNVLGDVIVRGHSTMSIQNGTLNIAANSMLMMDIDSTFEWNHASRTSLTMVDVTSRLFLNGATLHAESITNSGLQLLSGSLWFANKVTINNDANSLPSKSLQLGDGTSLANDVVTKVFGGALVDINAGYLNYDPA